jgi:hypothetical protein
MGDLPEGWTYNPTFDVFEWGTGLNGITIHADQSNQIYNIFMIVNGRIKECSGTFGSIEDCMMFSKNKFNQFS